MSKKIRRYSVLTLFCSAVVLLLSLLIFHTTDSAFAADYYRTFTINPASSTGTEAYPHAATDSNDYVYITYEEGTSSVDFIKSMNKGASFSSAVNVGTGVGYFPRIAVDNVERAFVIYAYENANTFYYPAIYTHPVGSYVFEMKKDWSTFGLSFKGASDIACADIAVESIYGVDNVYAVSDDYQTAAAWQIYFSSSTDGGGVSWGNPVAISTDADARYPTIAVNKETVNVNDVYVAWVHQNDKIMFDYTDDGGGAWQVADIQVSDGGAIPDNQRPGLAATEVSGVTWVFAVWTDVRNVNRDVYFSYANDTDGLSNWKTDDKRGDTGYAAYNQDQPSVAVEQDGTNHVYAVWRDTREGPHHIYFQEAIYQSGAFVWGIDKNADGSIDDGVSTEVGEDMRVSSGSNSEDTPTVVVSPNGEVYVVWREAGVGIKCARYDAAASGEPEAVAGIPDAPTNLAAVGSNGQVALSWTASTAADVTSYNIYRSTTRGSWPGTATYTTSGTTYTDSSVINGTCYWYVVTAVDVTALESGYSNDDSATPNAADTTAPGAPTGLTATGGYQKVDLSWTAPAADGVAKYHVYRGTAATGPYSYVNAVTAPTTTYSDTSLVGGITYYYVVTAVDTSNNESVDSTEANAAPSGSPVAGAPDAPTNLAAVGSNGQVALSWTASTAADVTSYNIYRSTTRGSWPGTATYTTSGTTYTDSSVTNGTCYWYVVTAVDVTALESNYSDDAHGTPSAADTTAPDAPTALAGTGGYQKVDLSWTASTAGDVSSYHVYSSTATGGPYSYVNAVTAPTVTYSDTSLVGGTTYYYVVTAVDASGNESVDSTEANAAPSGILDTPTGLTAIGGDGHAWLSWTAPATGSVYDYKIYRGTHVGGPYTYIATVGGSTTSYRSGGLTNGTTYYYVVTAIFDSVDGPESGNSNEASATANPVSGYPSAPTALTATAGDASVTLAWTHTKGLDFDHYNIYRSTTRGSWGTAVATDSASPYVNSGLSNGTTYWFVVTVVDKAGNESGFSNDANATPNPDDTDAPDTPANLQASGGDTMVALTWSPVSASDSSKYHVYRSIASGVNFYKIGEVNPDNWFFDGGLANGMTYYYVVTALDTSGNESGDSNEAIGIPRGGVGTGMGVAPGAPPLLPEGGGGGGCFIATACYGSPLAGEVRVLSRFRDNYLLTNGSGRVFVKGYYRLSPPIAGFIAEKPLLKSLVRIQLKPWVKIIEAITN